MIKIEIQIEQMPNNRISLSYTTQGQTNVPLNEIAAANDMIAAIKAFFLDASKSKVTHGKPITMLESNDNQVIEDRRNALRKFNPE